jgi:LacI family transcriptional regulator
MDYAHEHGYQINMSALQLRGDSRNMLAVLVPNIHHSFFSNIVSVITNLAYQKGYVVSVFQSNESYDQEKEIIKTAIRNNVAGVIASLSMQTFDAEHFKKLQNYHIPLVLFDRICPGIVVPTVTVNNEEAVTNVMELLIKKGYQRIAHISGSNKISVFRDRQSGYLAAVERNHLNYSKIRVIDSDFTIEKGKDAIEKLFCEEIKPDAILCDSHLLTIGAILQLKELKLRSPEDVGLAGYSDSPFIEAFDSNIITISQPEDAIANAAFELLLKKIENTEDEGIANLVFPAEIIER